MGCCCQEEKADIYALLYRARDLLVDVKRDMEKRDEWSRALEHFIEDANKELR